MGPSRAAGPRPRPDADQSACRTRAARELQVPHRRRHRTRARRTARAAGACRGRRDARGRGDGVCAVAGPRGCRSARHCQYADEPAAAHHAPADQLFRFDADRRADLAGHERRRWHSEPRRVWPGADGRRARHGRHRAGRAVLPQLAAHAHQHRRARAVCRRDDRRVRQASAALPRSRKDHGRVVRTPRRIVRRHQDRQGLHRRGARRSRLRDRRHEVSSRMFARR